MLDNGAAFELEGFEADFAHDLFTLRRPESWLIIPEGNGKTTFLSLLALYFGDYTQTAMVPIAASSREQAEIMYRQAEGLIARSPEFAKRFRAYDGYRRIKCERTGGRIQVYAADDRTADGIIPGGIALIDELHRLRDMRLVRTWRGKLKKRSALMVGISTAGEPGSEFEEVRAQMKRRATEITIDGCRTRAVGDRSVIHDFAVPTIEAAEDLEVVAQANPLSANTVEVLREALEAPSMTKEHWLRFNCNIAALEQGSAIPPLDWAKCAVPGLEIPDGTPVYIGLDLGWKWDTTAIVPVAPGDPLRVGRPTILVPPRDGSSLAEESIEAAIFEMRDRWKVLGLVFDRNAGGHQLAQRLEKHHGMTVIDHSQDPAPMSIAAERLYEAVREQRLQHPEDPALTAHVLAAARKATSGEKWRLVKAKQPIDAAIALAMAATIAMFPPVRERPGIEVFS